MLAEERRDRIVRLVNAQGAASLSELAAPLGVSESTIRRDIDALDQAGLVVRVHGGATRPKRANLVLVDQSFSERSVINAAEKDAIGAFAARLVGPDDFVYVDAGTTTGAMVEHLSETGATFFTNSLPIAQRLLRRGCRTLLPSGEVKPATEAIVGEAAIASLGTFNFTIGFFGTNGADVRIGFSTPEIGEAAIKRAALGRCLHAFVLCDSSKFSRVSLVSFADFGAASIVCDHATDEVRSSMAAAQSANPAIDLMEVAV